MARSKSRSGKSKRSPKSRSKSRSRSRRTPRKYSRSPTARSRKDVGDALRDVQWSGRGASNTLAVQKSIEQANKFNVPVSRKHMERLQKFSSQVLNMEYPECPLSWERHTRPVKEVGDKYGVVWRDQDGYFCAPPGLSPETVYKEEEKKKSPQNLKKEISDLTKDIQYALDPAKKSAEDKIQAEIRSRRIQALSLQNQDERNAYLKELKKEEEEEKKRNDKHVEVLAKIYDRFDAAAGDSKSKAEALLATAKRCTDGTGGNGCKSITVPDGDKTKTIFVPLSIVTENGIASQLQENLQAWWRRYRKSAEKLRQLRARGEVSRYM